MYWLTTARSEHRQRSDKVRIKIIRRDLSPLWSLNMRPQVLLSAVYIGKPSLLLSLDINAAFDTLDHSCLLKRAADLFGLSGLIHNWLQSYLTGRTTYISVGQCHSKTTNCYTGVPQGSVLGPFLFSTFTTTPVGQLFSSFGVSYHHADDAQLYTAVDLLSDADIMRLTKCADAVARWHLDNSLVLNASRTEALITGSRHQISNINRSNLPSGWASSVNQCLIPPLLTYAAITIAIRLRSDYDVSRACFHSTRAKNEHVNFSSYSYRSRIAILGVTVDSHLNFDDHVMMWPRSSSPTATTSAVFSISDVSSTLTLPTP